MQKELTAAAIAAVGSFFVWGGVEASEEMATEIANILSDVAIMGQQSQFNQLVQSYIDDGATPAKATAKAYLDMVGRVALAGVGGFLSGNIMAGAYNAPAAVANMAGAAAARAEGDLFLQGFNDDFEKTGGRANPGTENAANDPFLVGFNGGSWKVSGNETSNADKEAFENGQKDAILRSRADPMADAFGAGVDSNPEEIVACRNELEQAGVQLIERETESLGYCPGVMPGSPGTAYISAGASYSAWLHEMQHMRDDQAAGWIGMRIIADPDKRYEWEIRAYNVEIELATKMGRPDIVEKLKANLEMERKLIYGESFN